MTNFDKSLTFQVPKNLSCYGKYDLPFVGFLEEFSSNANVGLVVIRMIGVQMPSLYLNG